MSSYKPTGMTGSIVGTKTIVETPALLFAGKSQILDRSRLRITNMSDSVRIRIGVNSANLQRDGQPIEPGDTLTTYPTADIYGCSEGQSTTAQIEEK